MKIRFQTYCVFLVVLVLVTAVCDQGKSSANENAEAARAGSGTKFTYIANEGVLIESGDKKILIDGLHRFYKDLYAYPPDDLRDKLENALPPFDKIDLILVSHLHGDHFHPGSVALHLISNSHTKLASSEQISEMIKSQFTNYEDIASQIENIKYEWKKSLTKDFNGISVEFLGLRHANEQNKGIQNLGHLVEISGKKFLHIGDADMTAENFSGFNLHHKNVDVAFIPYWFLLSEDGRKLVKEQFDPKQTIAVHVPPGEADGVSSRLKSYDPDIIVFTEILESINID